ncbi:MAG TPA: thiol reductant ABC exporter subunit CydD [Acidimicrobiales bacterium]|nr:thiol reductant ABC exporter subunit CydD [Acidimicrobiales bacterium]
MSTPAADRQFGGLVDRRLAARVSATRRYLVVAVAVGLAGTVCVVAQAVLLATVVERVLLHHATLPDVAPQLAGLAAAFAARALCGWAGEAAAQRCGATVTSVLRRQLLRHALDLGPSWLAGERAGELSLAATRGTAALDAYFGRYLPQAVLAALAPVGILAWVGWTDWVSLVVLVVLVALVPVVMVLFGRRSAAETQRQWRRLSSLSARFLDLVRGLPTLRAFGRSAQGRQEVAAATEGLRQTTMATLRVAFLSALAMELIAGIGTGLVAMVLGLRLLDGGVPLYTALAVLLVSPEVFLPLRRAGAEFHASTEGQAAAQRILDILDEPLPAPSGPAAPAAPAAPAGQAGQAGGGRGVSADRDVAAETLPGPPAVAGTGTGAGVGPLPVTMAGVTVHYAGRAEPALDRFDLHLEPGEHVALVGPSGAGKSTVLAVLLGFVAPDAGAVRVGGVDLSAVDPASWRRQVAWVPQRPHLFGGTVADNLRLGDPGADDGRLRRVLAAVGLADLVAALPAGLDTPVGDGGLALSAGERQRLAIARAALRDVPLVLLDEPVAHLDRATEGHLRDALTPWLDGRAVLVAAHRPELVGRIDRTVAMGGTPAEAGDRTVGAPA